MSDLAIYGGSPVREKAFSAWPVWDEKEKEYLIKALDSGKWGYPQWEFVPAFEKHFAAFHDTQYGICFNSGTSALVAALWACGVRPGDEVIVPAYTFFASASAILQAGAIPVFADIESTNFHLDAHDVEEKITENTTAVMTVHIGGRPSDMTKLRGICDHHNLILIEDAAQAWGSEWRSKRVGAFGDAAIFSFQSSKNITCGEGGIVVTNDEKTAEYLSSYCNCGRLNDKPRYEHYYVGGNYRLDEFGGAVITAQFERYPELHAKRTENAEYLSSELSKIQGVIPVNLDEDVTANSFHIFLMRYRNEYFDELPKSELIEALRAEGIPAHPGYTVPLYKMPVFKNRAFGPRGLSDKEFRSYDNIILPQTENACDEEGLWFTQNILLGPREDIDDIVAAFSKIKNNIGELTERRKDG
ncbi:DegT/DnrJ/EryC1/StrS family aminotransferase [candidate division KSB1 bacterium]